MDPPPFFETVDVGETFVSQHEIQAPPPIPSVGVTPTCPGSYCLARWRPSFWIWLSALEYLNRVAGEESTPWQAKHARATEVKGRLGAARNANG